MRRKKGMILADIPKEITYRIKVHMNHKQLDVWRESMNLAEMIFSIKNISGYFSYQFQKSAISIPSNIAEGSARDSAREQIRFYRVSLGSLTELETQYLLLVRFDENYKNYEFENQIEKVKELILGTIRYLRNKL